MKKNRYEVYQPHHTGIEMENLFASFRTFIFYQPHHTGIEINNFPVKLRSGGPINRTTLELK